MKRIVALVPNVLGTAPGQRARIEFWAPHLEEAGWVVDLHPFEDERLHEILYQHGHTFTKFARLLECYLRHLRRTVQDLSCDVLFVYREAALVGPALTERFIARRPVPLVFDLDDPTFLPYRSPVNGWLSLLKFPAKTHTLFRVSDHVIAINSLIADHAARYNPSVSVIPNCIDTDRYKPVMRPVELPIRLGWIGSHSTIDNVKSIASPLRRLQLAAPVTLRLIGAGAMQLDGVRTEICPWSAETEVADLAACDIGLLPVADLPWNHWKFFFKAIQYMALAIPVVARRIGSNDDVIQDGVTGFLVETEEEWFDRLLTLVNDPDRRRQMGIAARTIVVEQYSAKAQIPEVLAVFDRMLHKSRCTPTVQTSSMRLPRRL